MSVLKIWFCLASILMSGVVGAGEVRFEEIASLIEQKNKKVKSLDSRVQSEEQKTGFLARSFAPDVALIVGQEDFHSDRLGDESSTFYGIEGRANIFNGMSDYWEQEKRESQVLLARAERRLGLSELIFEARKIYLELAEAKIVNRELTESLARLDSVFQQVRKKVQGGVTSSSDLMSLRLVQVEFEHEAKDLAGEIAVQIAHLKTLLGVSSLSIEDIDESVLTVDFEEAKKPSVNDLAISNKYDAEARFFSSQAKAIKGEKLPTVELFANYGRKPFSEREFAGGADREEWSAGLQLTWKVGQIAEVAKQEQGANLQATASRNLKEYYAEEVNNRIEGLEQKKRLLADSVQGLEKEIGLTQNYFSQVSAEYLRGVKSTSDLTSTYTQLLEIKRHRARIIVQYQLAQAEIRRLTGGN